MNNIFINIITFERGFFMNETIQNLISRRSIRKYKSEVPSKEIIDEILKAGMYAPTGRNTQSPIILAVTNKEMRDKMSKLNAKVWGNEEIDPFYGAPVVLVVLVDKTKVTPVYDGSLVMGNLMNAAHSLGIGSCWIHRAKEVFETEEGKEILKSLGIEGDYEGVGNCILGYPDCENPALPARKENYVYYID